MTPSDLVMVGYYDYRVVALSVLLAMLGSYSTIELAGRLAAVRVCWLISGATAVSSSSCSMHFTGMRAFRLSVPGNPRKLCARFSLSNCAQLTTGRWTRWLRG
jgi:NO-binding membrane sensor protein with MHYT domain